MDKQKKKIAEQILSWSEDDVAELLKLYDKKHITQHKKDIAKLTASENVLSIPRSIKHSFILLNMHHILRGIIFCYNT